MHNILCKKPGGIKCISNFWVCGGVGWGQHMEFHQEAEPEAFVIFPSIYGLECLTLVIFVPFSSAFLSAYVHPTKCLPIMQIMLPESVAIVMAPKDSSRYTLLFHCWIGR